ncbi:MAG TPA: hypothetical protein VNT26_24540 [Candidatus Sulfotelmatobacter sp.]|nr:hypothetical protein [Candidatus Sulfotelmatobacter sp.]
MKKLILTLVLAAFALSPLLTEARPLTQNPASPHSQWAKGKKHHKRHHRRHHCPHHRHHHRHHWRHHPAVHPTSSPYRPVTQRR